MFLLFYLEIDALSSHAASCIGSHDVTLHSHSNDLCQMIL